MIPPWVFAFFFVEGVLLLFHVSVAIVVLSDVLSNKIQHMYVTAFSVLYLLQSVADWGSYIFDCVVFRLMQYQVVPRENVKALNYNKIHYPITSFIVFFQCFVHLAIAVNRFTAISKPLAHSTLWKGWRLALAVITVFLLSFLCMSVRFLMDVRVVDDGEGGYALVNIDNAVDVAGAIVSVGASVLTCLLSCSFELSTLRTYRRLNFSNQWQHREDYRLLVYAMLELVGQILLAVYFAFLYVIGPMNKSIGVFTLRCIPYVIDILSLGGPICLFSTSFKLRNRYFDFYGLKRFRKGVSVMPVTTTVDQPSSLNR